MRLVCGDFLSKKLMPCLLDSHFERNLLALLCKQLERADYGLGTKLLVCIVADTFDNFEGRFEKVRNHTSSLNNSSAILRKPNLQ